MAYRNGGVKNLEETRKCAFRSGFNFRPVPCAVAARSVYSHHAAGLQYAFLVYTLQDTTADDQSKSSAVHTQWPHGLSTAHVSKNA
jgi:hypothetical protein